MDYCLRSKSEIYLIGFEEYQILGCKLPSNLQILSVFFHNHRTIKLDVRKSAQLAVQEVIIFWDKAKIPCRKEQHCVEKLLKLYNEWQSLSKNRSRKSNTQLNNEKEFQDKLSYLFDIAHANAMDTLDENGKQFLMSQRSKERVGHLGGVDKKRMQKDQRKSDRMEKSIERKRRCEDEKARLNGIVS